MTVRVEFVQTVVDLLEWTVIGQVLESLADPGPTVSVRGCFVEITSRPGSFDGEYREDLAIDVEQLALEAVDHLLWWLVHRGFEV